MYVIDENTPQLRTTYADPGGSVTHPFASNLSKALQQLMAKVCKYLAEYQI